MPMTVNIESHKTYYVTQFSKASDTQSVGHGFEPRPDHYNKS